MELAQQEGDLYGVAFLEAQNMAEPQEGLFMAKPAVVAEVQFLEDQVVVAEEEPVIATIRSVAATVEKLDLIAKVAEVRTAQNALALRPLIRIIAILVDIL